MKQIVYVDMDNVLVDFSSAIPFVPEDTRVFYAGHLDDVPGIFELMRPMPGAVEGFRTLAGRFDAYILSTAPWGNPGAWSDKVRWVQEYLGEAAYKRLILTHHKDLNRGDYLIDDRTKNGADGFVGELILFGSDAFPGWVEVVAYLMSTT